MIKAFMIYKEGVTTLGWRTILCPSEIFTDEWLYVKMEKFRSLGYKVKEL